jgi:hypothetical protein
MIRADVRNISRAILSALFGLLTACISGGKDAELFVLDLETAARTLKIEQTLRMDFVNKGKWDRIFLFSPYTPLQDIEAAIKSKAPQSVVESRISERDDANLLIFMNGNDIQIVAVIKRNVVDFSVPKSAQPLSRKQAVFARGISGNMLVLAKEK